MTDSLLDAAIALREDMLMRAKFKSALCLSDEIVVEAGNGVWLRFNDAIRQGTHTPPAWPADARFQYGDPASVIVKREGQPRFPGYVVGWYRPLDGRHTGWVLDHERDGLIHVNPDGAVQAGFYE